MDKCDLPLIVLEVGSKPTLFGFTYSVCRDPKCDCKGVGIKVVNHKYKVSFFIDFETGTYVDDDYSKEEREIIESFVMVMNSGKNKSFNIDFFKIKYREVKKQWLVRKNRIRSHKLGTMMPFSDIFGEGDNIVMKIGDKNYWLHDAYCVTPNCHCTTVALNLFDDADSSGRRKHNISFVYNYAEGSVDDITGENRELLEEIDLPFSNSMIDTFNRRREKIRKEVEPFVVEKIKRWKQRVIKKREKELLKRLEKRVGRNDPCPCGSGKKYKKCCLNNG